MDRMTLMGSFVFFSGAFAVNLAVFLSLRGRGDPVGWWLGIAHGGLCLLAIAGWEMTADPSFAVPMTLLAVYGGAMCISEIFAQLRETRRPA